uniref:Uncharacterized protein n=1 Tax=Thermosporothrix sp. COM3 TaxID=2490863 RepID=A0A455T2U9_9CHLR|nr:hypothetical protein KTC_64350 [Thermosporothrix sp. COM3]
MLQGWDRERLLSRPENALLKPELKRELLAHLAWHYHQQYTRDFTEDEVVTFIADFYQKQQWFPERSSSMKLRRITMTRRHLLLVLETK